MQHGETSHPQRALSRATGPSHPRRSMAAPEELVRGQDQHRCSFVMLCVGDYIEGCRYPIDIVTSLQPSMLNS